MKTPYLKAFGLALVLTAIVVASALPAAAKTKQSAEKYSVEQQGQTPNFTVTNNTKKDRVIAVELTLYSSQGVEQTSKAWDKQVIAPATSQSYSLGSLMLTPGGSPYRVVASIFSGNKKHKLIETVDPAGTFTVVH